MNIAHFKIGLQCNRPRDKNQGPCKHYFGQSSMESAVILYGPKEHVPAMRIFPCFEDLKNFKGT